MVTLVGANGAGKTTLLRTIVGLVRARAGEVVFDGRVVTGSPPRTSSPSGFSLVPERRHVFADLTVLDNLLLGGMLCPAAATAPARCRPG